LIVCRPATFVRLIDTSLVGCSRRLFKLTLGGAESPPTMRLPQEKVGAFQTRVPSQYGAGGWPLFSASNA
jgi:hypothetical protein